MSEFDPTAVRTITKTDNMPPDELAMQTIRDLYDEAKNWADGEPITSEDMHGVVSDLDAQIAAAAKKADDMRKAEKKPHDDAAAGVQKKWADVIDTKKGKAVKAREALKTMLTEWRSKVAKAEEERAAQLRAAAIEASRNAQEAMRESAGNLDAREDAEEAAATAKKLEKEANRAVRDAGKGLGLRTRYVVEIANDADALDWAFSKNPGGFLDMALTMARDHATTTKTETIPGFRVIKEKAL